MAGYTRQSTAGIVDGGVISASDLNNEFNQVQTAMGTGGHDHSGTAGNGPKLTATGLADNAVTTAKINADAVTNAKIADDSIDSEHYVDGSIDTAHLADNAVTAAKLDETGSYTVAGLTVSSASIVLEGATADDFETTITVADPTADRTVTIQDATDTLVGRATTDTLTNKSISLTNNTVTGSLSEFNTALSGDSFVSLTGTETLTNKTLTSPTASGLSLSDSSVVFEGSTANDFETTLTVTDPTADRTVTIKDASGTVAFTSDITLGTLSVNATASELNILDGDTSATSTTLADADRVVVNDAGTMKQVALTDFETYFEGALDTLSNVTTVGALDSGSITSGFGNVDVGSSNLTATGTVSLGATSFNDNAITNVGDIALDSISADGTDINVAVSDNSATAFTIKQGSDNYLVIDTGDNSESISIGTGVSGTAISIGHGTSETTVNDNLTVTGDLTVSGTTTTVNSTTVSIADANFELASTNNNDGSNGVTTDAVDFGVYGNYNSDPGSANTTAYSGFFRDASDSGKIKFYTGLQAEPTTTVDTSGTGYAAATVVTGTVETSTITSPDTDGNIAITPNGTGEVDISKVDIDSGAIDGTTIGANSAAAGTFSQVTLASGASVTSILDQDDFSSDSDTALATQQSIKAYIASQLTASTPAGVISPYAGASAPTGYLLCFGQAVSRTTYSDLFSAISTTYGAGDGSSTFNLPDLRGRVIAGQDDMGGSAASRLTGDNGASTATANANGSFTTNTNILVDGNSGTITLGMKVTGSGISGEVTVVKINSQTDIILSSAVTITDNTALTFAFDGAVLGSSGGAETHRLQENESGLVGHTHSNTLGVRRVSGTDENSNPFDGYPKTSGTSLSTDTNGIGGSITAVTGAQAANSHNNVQPTIILNYIIKT